jgi:hypothetical protein
MVGDTRFGVFEKRLTAFLSEGEPSLFGAESGSVSVGKRNGYSNGAMDGSRAVYRKISANQHRFLQFHFIWKGCGDVRTDPVFCFFRAEG